MPPPVDLDDGKGDVSHVSCTSHATAEAENANTLAIAAAACIHAEIRGFKLKWWKARRLWRLRGEPSSGRFRRPRGIFRRLMVRLGATSYELRRRLAPAARLLLIAGTGPFEIATLRAAAGPGSKRRFARCSTARCRRSKVVVVPPELQCRPKTSEQAPRLFP